jgi:hypothetical protein
MTSMFDRPRWGGFVIMYEDGRTVSFQMDHPQVELTVEYDQGQVSGDFRYVSQVQAPIGRIRATMEGLTGKTWDRWRADAPTGEIEHRREIES